MAYSNIFKSMTNYDESYLDDYEHDKGVVFCRTKLKIRIKIVFCRNYAKVRLFKVR